MASQVLGDDFTGATFEDSAALLQTGITGAVWSTTSDFTFGSGLFTRTELGATLSPTGETNARRRATVNIVGMVLGAGVNVFEISGFAQPELRVCFGTTSVFYLLRVANNNTGTWSGSSPPSTSFATGLHDLTTPVVLRLEVEATTSRMYVDGVLVGTRATGKASGTQVPQIFVEYVTSSIKGLPTTTTNLLLKYVHFKTDTVSGALGAPSFAPPPTPVVLVQDDFRAAEITLLRGSPWVGSAVGVWDVSPSAGQTARRTSGGLIVDVPVASSVVTVSATVINNTPIGTGVAVARFVFYGNPAITISFASGGYLMYLPSGVSALVGTNANLVSVADATTMAARSEIWFHFGPAGTSIWKNGVSIYSDTSTSGQIGAAAIIRSVQLSWSIFIANITDGQLLPGAKNIRILDWVLVEHGRPTETASVSPPPTAPITGLQKDCVRLSQIYGSYTVGGVRTIIVPRATGISIVGVDYPAGQGPNATGGVTVTSRDGRTDRKTLPRDLKALDIPSSMQGDLFLPNNCAEVSTQYPPTLEYRSVTKRDYPWMWTQVLLTFDGEYYPKIPGTLVRFLGLESFATYDRFFTRQLKVANPNRDMGWGGYGGVAWDVFDAGTVLIVPHELTTVAGIIGKSIQCVDFPTVFEDPKFADDFGLPESDPPYSAVITLQSTSGPQVCDGPADGVKVDRIVILGIIPPSEITRLNITIYPDYINRSPKPLLDPDRPPDPHYSLFWTAFDDSYEAP